MAAAIPFIGPALGLGGAVIGARSSRRAADQVAGASDAATAEQRRQFDIATDLARPGIDAGNTARNQLMELLGLQSGGSQGVGAQGFGGGSFGNFGGGGFGGSSGLPFELRQRLGLDGGQGPSGFQPIGGPVTRRDEGGGRSAIDIIKDTPGYQFQLDQGARALNANRSSGGISGGEVAKDFARFNQGVASNFYSDYANRLAGLAGSAQTASSQLGSQGIASGQIIGNSIQNAGNARASGVLGRGNAIGGFLEQLGGLDFESIFKRSSGGSPGLSGSNGGPI